LTTSITFGSAGRAQDDKDDKPYHGLGFGCATVRTVAPFDWLAFLRQWRFDWEEARVEGHVYYRVKGVFKEVLGLNPCLYLPDDWTIVYDEEEVIRKIASGEGPALPAFLRGKEWERVSRGLITIAIKNNDDTFAKHYDLGHPPDAYDDDAVVLSLFKGIDWWVLGVDAADSIVLHADAIARGREASGAVSRQIDSLITLGRQILLQALDPKSPEVAAHENTALIFKALAANVRVEHTDTVISVHTQAVGTLADFAAIVAGEAQESKARVAARRDAKQSVKQ
jgi:hypothetical protein